MKTLAIRLDDDLHARLSVMAQLAGTTITDEIRRAIDRHLQGMATDPELTARASSVLEEIEREAQAKQQAITSLFGKSNATGATAPAAKPTGRKGSRTEATG